MQKFFSFFMKGSARFYVLAAIVVVAGGYYVFSSGNGNAGPTIVVQPANFATQVSVSGTVTPAQAVDLGFSQSGRVTSVNGAVGDHVAAGTVLATVENGDLQAAVAQAQAALAAAQANLDLLKQGTRPEQLAVAQSAVDSDTTGLAQANQSILNAINTAYTTADGAVHNTADQFFYNPRTANPTLMFIPASVTLTNRLVAERVAIEPMLAAWKGSIANLTATDDLTAADATAESNLAATVALLADANAALNQVASQENLTNAQIATYISSVAAARASLDSATAGLTDAVTAGSGAAAALDAAQKQLALEQAGSTASSIAAQAAQVQVAEANVASAEAELAKSVITAPFDGTITRMDAKVGQIISPSDSEISMMGDGLFEIDTYIPELSIAGVVAGDAATTTLDAYGANVPFAASVVSVDPAETVENGVSTYKTTLTFLAADPRIRSGMTANVTITTGTLTDAIVVPQGSIGVKNGQSYISVLENGKPVDVVVTTGISPALGQMQITSGLSAGEQLLLAPSS